MSAHRVEMKNVRKFFGGVRALDDVTFRLHEGEIHALAGENGAGKSTLMKVLAGVHRMDGGTMLLDGVSVHLSDPHAARAHGIAAIHQEFSLAGDLSVAENIFLARLGGPLGLVPWRKLWREAAKHLHAVGFDISPRARVRDLSVAQRQAVEIAKALSGNARILILDEPTSVLAPREARQLFQILQRLRDRDVSIVYISHRLEEILEVADRITVMKDGKITGTVNSSETDHDGLIRMMIGRQVDTLFRRRHTTPGEVLLQVDGLCLGQTVKDVSLTVRAGEIVGLAGLVGSGRTETVRAIFGAEKRSAGRVRMMGSSGTLCSPAAAVGAGIGFVPEDRRAQGGILSLPLRANVSLPSLWRRFTRAGFLKHVEERRAATDMIARFAIKAPSDRTALGDLSGGNQQKVVLAKWLAAGCRVILLDEPTRGVDVGAKVEIYKLVNALAEKGLGILMISSELTELIGLCDRVLVMRRGRIQGELTGDAITEARIMELAIVERNNEATGVRAG